MKQIINQKYRTVMCDPPWDINQKGKRGSGAPLPAYDLRSDQGHAGSRPL